MGVITINRYERNLARFTGKWPNHWDKENDFGGFFRWKIRLETGNKHILDENNREETHSRLCRILPGWGTYRPFSSVVCLGRLKNSLKIMSNAYSQIKEYSLLEFDKAASEPLRLVWDELGRVKEENGNTNDSGTYFVKAVSVPLMLLWGQTPAFDSNVRRNFLEDFPMYPKHRFGRVWSFENWKKVMKRFQEDLEGNPEVVEYFREESLRIFGTDSIVPYGRFLDIHYYF